MKTLLLTLGLLAALAESARADNFRCPNGAIVSTGDTMAEVYVECDPPSFKNVRTESEAGYRGTTILINVEEWTYNEGPHRLMHTLTFRNGVLEKVQTLGYGK
ncbi:DUF2845 domain-containing protein [Trichlorobacter sp.]|uniref:DUF2845 domain-containing protein n=1 Tax=Trichlorobacter sp. TaxID=2911007 RepID=UPI002A3703EE|nr:DUF2845 domain-containing protein [Trichlorobacter sp.]MDY0383799.1 DUF2845 domain-containing protein [Trichlorobacter sp.]